VVEVELPLKPRLTDPYFATKYLEKFFIARLLNTVEPGEAFQGSPWTPGRLVTHFQHTQYIA
jgi:hypothetical protein